MDDSTQRGGSRETLIMDALSDALRILDGAEDTARARALRTQARSFEQAIKHWTAVAPTFAQLDAMFDLVTELHGHATAAERRRGR